MYFQRRILVLISCMLLISFSFACSGDTQPFDADEKKQLEKVTVKGKKENDRSVHSKHKANEEAISSLKGGSEKEQRELKPASNAMLQSKFPQTLILQGSYNDPRIALTFDDGPDRRFTPQVLDVLKKHDVKATFFLMGSRAHGLPIITKRIDEEGHSIGNHTYWHPKLYIESLERTWWEVKETEKVISDIVGYKPKLFRAPYGGLNEPLLSQLADMELTVIGWSVDSLDWKGISAKEVENNVLSHTVPGSIILMHSGGHWTQDLSGMVEALDAMIPKLKEQGLEFVTVAELLNIADRS